MTQGNTSLKSTAQEIWWKWCAREQLNILVSKNGYSAPYLHRGIYFSVVLKYMT